MVRLTVVIMTMMAGFMLVIMTVLLGFAGGHHGFGGLVHGNGGQFVVMMEVRFTFIMAVVTALRMTSSWWSF